MAVAAETGTGRVCLVTWIIVGMACCLRCSMLSG